MPALCTNSEVFEFCGTPADVQTTQGTAITNLIVRVEAEIENMLGRKVTTEDFSNVLFKHGVNCDIFEQKLYLKGKYRDTYLISAITEAGVALTAIADYNDGGGYYFQDDLGILIREPGVWLTTPYAIKISGKRGIGKYVSSTFTPNADIKQACIEMVAAKSGLWKQNVVTEGGTIMSIRTTPNKLTLENLTKYVLRDI